MPAPFSNDIEYEKPEHPPPTTPTRSPAGTGFCCAMISFTLAIAVAVRLSGLVATLGAVVVFGVVVVVAIISPLKLAELEQTAADLWSPPASPVLPQICLCFGCSGTALRRRSYTSRHLLRASRTE